MEPVITSSRSLYHESQSQGQCGKVQLAMVRAFTANEEVNCVPRELTLPISLFDHLSLRVAAHSQQSGIVSLFPFSPISPTVFA